MKSSLLTFCLMAVVTASAQRKFTAAVATNFDLGASGFGTNNAGIGITLSANCFGKSRLQLHTEASVDHFIGSKLGYIDANGNVVGNNPTVVGLKTGPEFFLAKNFSLTGLYGITTFEQLGERTTTGIAKIALNIHVGSNNKGVLAFAYTVLSDLYPGVHFFSFHAGYNVF